MRSTPLAYSESAPAPGARAVMPSTNAWSLSSSCSVSALMSLTLRSWSPKPPSSPRNSSQRFFMTVAVAPTAKRPSIRRAWNRVTVPSPKSWSTSSTVSSLVAAPVQLVVLTQPPKTDLKAAAVSEPAGTLSKRSWMAAARSLTQSAAQMGSSQMLSGNSWPRRYLRGGFFSARAEELSTPLSTSWPCAWASWRSWPPPRRPGPRGAPRPACARPSRSPPRRRARGSRWRSPWRSPAPSS